MAMPSLSDRICSINSNPGNRTAILHELDLVIFNNAPKVIFFLFLVKKAANFIHNIIRKENGYELGLKRDATFKDYSFKLINLTIIMPVSLNLFKRF